MSFDNASDWQAFAADPAEYRNTLPGIATDRRGPDHFGQQPGVVQRLQISFQRYLAPVCRGGAAADAVKHRAV